MNCYGSSDKAMFEQSSAVFAVVKSLAGMQELLESVSEDLDVSVDSEELTVYKDLEERDVAEFDGDDNSTDDIIDLTRK